MTRGDILTVAGGVYASKPRPALVIQDDRFDATDSVTVCAFTTTTLDAPLLRLEVEADSENGLEQVSYLMIDQVTTVRRSNATATVGRLSRPPWLSSSSAGSSSSSASAADRPPCSDPHGTRPLRGAWTRVRCHPSKYLGVRGPRVTNE